MQTASYLGFEPDHIPLLIKPGLLKLLGRPKPNCDKYFATIKLTELRQNVEWLSRATMVVSQHWKDKNGCKSKGRADDVSLAVRQISTRLDFQQFRFKYGFTARPLSV